MKKSDIVIPFIEEHFPEGIVTPPRLLELAKPKNSPIHPYFTWNDSEAAHQHRLWQARQLIDTIYVEIEGKRVRKYVEPIFIDDSETQRAYVDINKAASNAFLWEQVLVRALKDVEQWQMRYEAFLEFKPIFKAVKTVKRKLHGKEASRKTKNDIHPSSRILLREDNPPRRNSPRRTKIQ